MNPSQGLLYVFEGVDGVGKSDLSARFAAHLVAQGVRCEQLAFPGNRSGTLGQHVYCLHHAPQQLGVNSVTAAATQLLHIAAHIDAIETRILPLLRSGVTVILDRFWWSTFVYGAAAGVARPMLDKMITVELATWNATQPEAVFLIKRQSSLRSEPEELWPRWRDLYDSLAEAEANHYPVHVIDNDGHVDDTLRKIISRIARRPSTEGIAVDTSNKSVEEPISPRRLFVFSSLSPARPTKVFDTYWSFAAERQAIFFRRLRGLRSPWTTDAILRAYKFTNAYRASDRVSQYLIRSVAYAGDSSPEELFFRIVLFKFFNRIDTWCLLTDECGGVSYANYSYKSYDRVLTNAIERGQRIYSAAYIMPSGHRVFGTARKHQSNLRLLEKLMEDEVPLRLREMTSMAAAFRLLRSYPMLGDFLAYQYVTDLNYSLLTDFSETEFVIPGPGARNGIAKCFSSLGGFSETDVIKITADRQEREFADRGIEFTTLWGRQLQLIDCQNIFCEVDKYARVKHPEIRGLQAKIRIKQKFSATAEPIEYWYPPKWGINRNIEVDKNTGVSQWR